MPALSIGLSRWMRWICLDTYLTELTLLKFACTRLHAGEKGAGRDQCHYGSARVPMLRERAMRRAIYASSAGGQKEQTQGCGWGGCTVPGITNVDFQIVKAHGSTLFVAKRPHPCLDYSRN